MEFVGPGGPLGERKSLKRCEWIRAASGAGSPFSSKSATAIGSAAALLLDVRAHRGARGGLEIGRGRGTARSWSSKVRRRRRGCADRREHDGDRGQQGLCDIDCGQRFSRQKMSRLEVTAAVGLSLTHSLLPGNETRGRFQSSGVCSPGLSRGPRVVFGETMPRALSSASMSASLSRFASARSTRLASALARASCAAELRLCIGSGLLVRLGRFGGLHEQLIDRTRTDGDRCLDTGCRANALGEGALDRMVDGRRHSGDYIRPELNRLLPQSEPLQDLDVLKRRTGGLNGRCAIAAL